MRNAECARKDTDIPKVRIIGMSRANLARRVPVGVIPGRCWYRGMQRSRANRVQATLDRLLPVMWGVCSGVSTLLSQTQ
jgi:hypothetical protein